MRAAATNISSHNRSLGEKTDEYMSNGRELLWCLEFDFFFEEKPHFMEHNGRGEFYGSKNMAEGSRFGRIEAKGKTSTKSQACRENRASSGCVRS